MDGSISEEESIDWDTEDEQEINQCGFDGETSKRLREASSSFASGNAKLIQHFVGMGFSEKFVVKVIEENGAEDAESILEVLLTYSALQDTSDKDASDDCSVTEFDGSFLDSSYDSHDSLGNEESSSLCVDNDDQLLFLASMGYTVEEASIAIERCGPNSTIEEVTDFICAAQVARESDAVFIDHITNQKRKILDCELLKQRKQKQKHSDESDTIIHLPKPMIGFGVPDGLCRVDRNLPEAAIGPPFFYFENVALAPKGVWERISRFLYDVEPEFVDSKYFCAATRKRGYVHNLPIKDRYPLLPLPPSTIHEAFPLTKKWWPSWDTRKKLNCLQTVIGSAKTADRIRKSLEPSAGFPGPPLQVQKYVLEECRKWNLLWVGINKVAPLEPDEVELLLGFPKNHTRGGGSSKTDRYKSLGNSFQVDTVAFHLSVLKTLFPCGLTVLSLFSGIGGAEVALHRLGIPLKAVVSVEISETNRNVVRSWWEQTGQRGDLIHVYDVQELNTERIEQFIASLGGFDLVVGGSPCNNLTGSNRVSRDGLEGKDSSLFYDYYRVLDTAKNVMSKKR